MQAHGADGARRRGRIPLSRAVRGAVVLEAAAGAFLGGRDGTTVWQLTRVLFVVACATAALYGVQRRTGWGRGLVALTLGAIGWAVGLGVGATHLVKVGRSPVTVAGLACLVAGVVLLVAGVVNVTRAARGWRRPLAGLTAVLVVFLVVQPLAPALYATNVPPTSLGVLTPADRGLAYRDVALRTPDGVTLSGWYVPSRNGAAVVLLHGAGSTRSAMLRYAVVLARHGYGVLLYDARGHGRSGGRAMDLGWYGDQDLAGAVSFLQTRQDVTGGRIVAVGVSMGGEEAVGAVASDPHIRAVVGDGVTGRTAADQGWLPRGYGVRGWLWDGWTAVLTYGVADLLTAAHPPISLRAAVGRAAPRPVLLIAAGDARDEVDADRYIRAGAPGTVQLWVAPATRHAAALATHPAEWERRVTAFLDRATGRAG